MLDLKSVSGDGFNKTESKWESFKGGQGTSKNAFLQEAKRLATSDAVNSKRKYREGCQSIYDSEFSDSGDLWNDFKSYCSRTNADAFGTDAWVNGTISADTAPTSPWKEKLDALKSNDSILPKSLLDLKNILGSDGTTYTAQQATTLKTWCDTEKANSFEGTDSEAYKYLGKFCRT